MATTPTPLPRAIYRWREGARISADAQAVGPQIEQLLDRYPNGLAPVTVVREAAKQPGTPLHGVHVVVIVLEARQQPYSLEHAMHTNSKTAFARGDRLSPEDLRSRRGGTERSG
jgi:hypothetical protein